MIILPTEKRFDWAKPPIVLLFLVISNVGIYLFYQTADSGKINQALEVYFVEELFDVEWGVYREYLENSNQLELLYERDEQFDQGADLQLAYFMLLDQQFYGYMNEHSAEIFGNDYDAEDAWRATRKKLDKYMSSTSSASFALVPNQLEISTLFSYQFMHGSLMHLVGNIFFLIMCGFAVEASIGHIRFLVFYLSSGVMAGLAHAAIDMTSDIPLVGASGSIFGVMAMYIMIFKFKKIEFFYWFFVFVGYFRAPAVAVLPFYVGKELLSFATDKDSSVAFMAHIGGFVTGGAMMLIAQLIKPGMMNEEYIEEDQSVDPYQERLGKVYAAISHLHFVKAYSVVQNMLKEYGDKFELRVLQYNLLRLSNNGNDLKCAVKVLAFNQVSDAELKKQNKIWKENETLDLMLSDDQLVRIGMRFTNLKELQTAESIFTKVMDKGIKTESVGIFCRKLAVRFERIKDPDKARKYSNLADKFLGDAS